MEFGSPLYEKIKAEIPELAGPETRIWARFRIEPELDYDATAATGKVAPEVENTEVVNNDLVFTLAPVTNAGFDVYRDAIYCEKHIITDGRETEVVSEKLKREHILEFADAWAHFQRWRERNAHDLRLIRGMTPAGIATLAGIGVRCVEDLAACERELPGNLGDLRTYAKRYLAFINGEKPRMRLVDGQLQEVA